MLAKSIFAATFFALAQFAVATPPGCLLGAVNEYSDPADLKSVCKAKDAATKIASFCGNNTKEAMSAFADICNGQGVKVSTDVPTSTSVSVKPSGDVKSHDNVKPSGTGAASAHGTGAASASGTGSIHHSGNSTLFVATGTPKPTSMTGTSTGGSSEHTGAAGKLEAGLVAAFAGFVAFAL